MMEPPRTAPPPPRWLLRPWFILLVLANAWAAYRYYETIKDFVDHADPRFTGTLQWGLYALTALALISLVFVGAMWRMRKWGFYGYLAANAVALVIVLMIGVPLSGLLIPLVGLGVLWWLVISRWSEFR